MYIAYALTADYEGTIDLAGDTEGAESEIVPVYGGGVVTIDGDNSFDIGEALETGEGIIVLEETDPLIPLLDAYPALKRVPVPEGATITGSLDAMNLNQLRGEAKRLGLQGYSGANKVALKNAILEFKERVAAGDNTVNDDPEVSPEGDGLVPDPDPADGDPEN